MSNDSRRQSTPISGWSKPGHLAYVLLWTILSPTIILASEGQSGNDYVDGILAVPYDPPPPASLTGYPFSFLYDGHSSSYLLKNWTCRQTEEKLDDNRHRRLTTWTDSGTGLRVHWDVIRYQDFPAVEWLISLENTAERPTPVIQDIQTLDLTLQSPLSPHESYRLHRTNGSPSDPTDFEPRMVILDPAHPQTMSGKGGRSSYGDFPFFKIESGLGSTIIAVGWSGQWKSTLQCPYANMLRITTGLERTHFRLLAGEKVRMPRILLMQWPGDTLESNAQFRQLIYKHYAATRSGQKLMPTLFCNTCFTRGGGWLNECNAENQISLIKAYGKIGLEALITDAGWFEGGWPQGAGNWTPRKDAYPNGMAPVAAAAKENQMAYGLWFEPERVVPGTWLHQNHPEWLLRTSDWPDYYYLLNFGLPEARDYFFNIVKGFMELPGFGVYRQDFNWDPLAYWRFHDAPDRQGITEIKYIEGLYAYWDRIAQTWPEGLREECASGGRRIDLETIMRMHIHQKTDHWFNNEDDQASIFGLSQYLPNNCFVTTLTRLDDYSFHSTLASSLCLGWIADAPDFDFKRAAQLLDRYRQVRHLLIGAWYPLLPYTRDPRAWMASQYHRPDLDEGMLLVFRHGESPYSHIEIALHALNSQAQYNVVSDRIGSLGEISGQDLMRKLEINLPEKPQSDLIIYRRVRS